MDNLDNLDTWISLLLRCKDTGTLEQPRLID